MFMSKYLNSSIMNILGVIDITPKEIRDFISIAREHVGKEKNATCFVLAAQNETIL